MAWMPKPQAVDVGEVTPGPMRVTVDEVARARVKDRYVVSAPLAGNLARIELRAGDRVKEKTVVARILPVDPPLLDARSRSEAEARLAQAQAARLQANAGIGRAQVAADHAKSDFDQASTLAKQGAISPTEKEHAEVELRLRNGELVSAKFAAQVADHDVEVATAALAQIRSGQKGEQFEIRAPVEGSVLKVLHESGGVVGPGTPLLEIGDPAALEVVSDVLTSDAVRIKEGAHVSLERWGGDPLAGHVRTVEPSAFTRIAPS